MRFLPIVLLLVTGCATGHSVRPLPGGITLHTFTREFANAHLVVKDGRYFLFDAGIEAQAPALAKDLKEKGFDPAKLSAIVVSHGHYDHAGGARHFQKTYGTKVVAGRGDQPMIAVGKSEAELCPTDWIARSRVQQDGTSSYTPYTPDVLLDADTDLLELTGVPAKAFLLPGHTPGSLVVVVADAVLVGDTFRGALVGSGAEVHFYICDLEGNRRDVRRILEELAPGATTFHPGHLSPASREQVEQRFPR